jgi:hypothetical protein
LEALYKFQLSDDLLRVCQKQCIEIINESNVKNVLLSAKLLVATFLFDACFEYVCQHFFRYYWKKDIMFAWDVAMVDGQLCRDIVEAARQWFEQNARWVRLNGMGHSPAKSSLVAWYGLELIQISYLAVATVIIRVFFQ